MATEYFQCARQHHVSIVGPRISKVGLSEECKKIGVCYYIISYEGHFTDLLSRIYRKCARRSKSQL